MKKIIDFIKDIFWTLFLILFGVIIASLSVFLTLLFMYFGFIWSLLITILFLPFHIVDFKSFFLNKNWFAFFGRFICLYTIASFIGGYVVYMSGLMYIEQGQFVGIIAIFSVIISFTGVPFTLILHLYFSKTSLYRKIQKTIDGLYAIGVLWRY